jgi:hypothetical protein
MFIRTEHGNSQEHDPNIAVSYAYNIQGIFIYVPLITRVKLELQGKFKMSVDMDRTSAN